MVDAVHGLLLTKTHCTHINKAFKLKSILYQPGLNLDCPRDEVSGLYRAADEARGELLAAIAGLVGESDVEDSDDEGQHSSTVSAFKYGILMAQALREARAAEAHRELFLHQERAARELNLRQTESNTREYRAAAELQLADVNIRERMAAAALHFSQSEAARHVAASRAELVAAQVSQQSRNRLRREAVMRAYAKQCSQQQELSQTADSSGSSSDSAPTPTRFPNEEPGISHLAPKCIGIRSQLSSSRDSKRGQNYPATQVVFNEFRKKGQGREVSM
jgi:hypothetical protein